MVGLSTRRRAAMWRMLAALSALLLSVVVNPVSGAAQTCTDCVVYAISELNVRQGPGIDTAVLRIVPQGAPLQRSAGAEMNGYAPVTYDAVPGWVVAFGLAASLEEIAPVENPEPAPADSGDARVTLAPLLLRGGPSSDAESILVMPEGSLVTLTREGAENGYVTVDYGGATGWAYADLLGEAPGEA